LVFWNFGRDCFGIWNFGIVLVFGILDKKRNNAEMISCLKGGEEEFVLYLKYQGLYFTRF
jgi:hypothetical protein